MNIITKVVREVFKNFYNIVLNSLMVVKIFFNYKSEEESNIDLYKIVFFIISLFILFCILTRLFASNYYIKDIIISITAGFLINELLIYLVLGICLFIKYIEFNKEQSIAQKIDDIRNESITDIEIIKNWENIETFGNFTYYCFFEDFFEDFFVVKPNIYFSCAELIIYILICVFFNNLIRIDKILIFLVLIIISLKTCFKTFINNKDDLICLEITRYDIFYLITYVIIFILSLYVKLVRDILVNLILSVFYSIILSLFISIIYYGRDDFINRLKVLLKDDVVLRNNDCFNFYSRKIGIEYIFMGCFILYFIIIFKIQKLFSNKKTIVKMDY